MEWERIAANLNAVKERVNFRCQKNAIDPAGIVIIGISKGFPAEAASAAIKAGLKQLGENKVQEAEMKIPLVKPRPQWHMVGHLQKNKVKKALEIFDCIQSVDSLDLAKMISDHSQRSNRIAEIYLQVNSSFEKSKSGFNPAEILSEADEIKKLGGLKIRGLMTIGPLTENTQIIEKSFSLTKELFDNLKGIVGEGFSRLSMGMSADFELAIDHGANVLRIGTAIFGARN